MNNDFYLNVCILDKDSPTPRRLVRVHVQPEECITELYLPPKQGLSAIMITSPWSLKHRVSKTDEYISYVEAIQYIKEAFGYIRDMSQYSDNTSEYDFEKTVGTWYFEDMSDKLANMRLKEACAKRIQAKWRECISNPYHPICKRRLQNEFSELS